MTSTAIASVLSTSLAIGLTLFVPAVAIAWQPPRQMPAAELARAIERLSVAGNVLYVAAHPDDENTRLLAWLQNERLLRAAYLSVTRGDGGQNLIGSEQGPLLGLIRTQELLAARRIDGAEQRFTRARDFGYSKTAAETLSIWNKDEVLSDVVWQIRHFKPDVIITRFPTKGGDTHGHHTASAMLALEAFKAAGDPGLFKGMEGVSPWQPKRIVWNKGLFNAKPNEDLSGFMKMDVGQFNPALGVSYGEMAATSRSMHKSQGFGAAPSRGTAMEYFQVLDGEASKTDIFEGIDLTWGRVKGSEKLRELLSRAKTEFNPRKPEAIIPLLWEIDAAMAALPDNPWKDPKREDLKELIAGCAGLFLEAAANDFANTAGGELSITATAINRSGAALTLKEVRVRVPEEAALPVGKALVENDPVQVERTFKVPANLPLTNPYWLAETPKAGTYSIPVQSMIANPESPPSLIADFVLTSSGHALTLSRPILYKWTDPVAGERYRSIEIAPPVMVNSGAQVVMFPDAQARELSVRVKAGVAGAAGTLKLAVPADWKAEPASVAFKLEKKGDEEEFRFKVRPPLAKTASTPITGVLKAVVDMNGAVIDRGVTRIDYSHIPIQTLFPQADVKLVRFDLVIAGKRIGYIAGAGDEVPAALRQVGYEVTLLSDETLRDATPTALSRFDAIVTGVRAYNTRSRLAFLHDKLMAYVKAGGHLIAQYSTQNRISKVEAKIGPYPFDISQDRVTDESAEVKPELPAHPVLNRPNKLDDADFHGWIQERGLYFANKWDEKYETPLSMHDPGEDGKRGSLLVTKYGKGAFIYTGLSFFRQLPAGVPGAYRLLANLIAYGK